ncbi:MAG: hypothetical protein K8R90_05425 [Candidatus Cloacimonetes bacterium]|nr:hypothetical protein [Candidatus Cloacimonadota bacterium]
MAHLRSTGRLWPLAAALIALWACDGGSAKPAPLQAILHGSEAQSERLNAVRAWLGGRGVDVLYVQTDAKDIYNRTVLVVRTADVDSRERLLALTGIDTWIWARQEKPAAPFEIYVGDDIEELMNTNR